MHYANGRPAKVGDKIIGRDASGSPLAGIVIDIYPATNTCNLSVIPLPAPTYTATANDCLHIDDLPSLKTT